MEKMSIASNYSIWVVEKNEKHNILQMNHNDNRVTMSNCKIIRLLE
jgi:hypothetical protein